jgi:hypothetical protein
MRLIFGQSNFSEQGHKLFTLSLFVVALHLPERAVRNNQEKGGFKSVYVCHSMDGR